MIRRTLWGAWLLAAALGCGGGPEEPGAPAPEAAPARGRGGAPLVPPGYGTLRQDAFTVPLRVGDLLIKATPLSEGVIRLAAPDTYDRLRDLALTHHTWARDVAARAGLRDDPLLFLVSFFTFAPRSEYTPTDLQLVSEGRLYRPLDFVPLTPGFGIQFLQQEQTQIALYAFDPSVDLNIPLRVQYGTTGSDAWEQILSLLETERARVRARTKAEGTE